VSFNSFELDPKLMAAVEDLGYIEPTPIQEKGIPPVLEGRDLIGLAQTGTGKTAAFALPILQCLLAKGMAGRTRALILAPTRELAEQIHCDIGDIGKHTKIRSTPVYGGVRYKQQISDLQKGVEIVVACPGRLLDHMGRGVIDLSGLAFLVIDEADRMFDMGFLPDIRRILRKLPTKRQSLLFSATMPYDIRRLASEMLRDPITVEIGLRAPPMSVSHALYAVAPTHKTELLLEILRQTDTDSVLVFTKTKHGARSVGTALAKVGFAAATIQGDMTQRDRQSALDGFRSGRYQVLVATDIAARGLDISMVSHVINYDMPSTVDDYTHRIGRTGRAAKTGDAFTFVTHEDLEMVVGIEKVLGTTVEYKRVEGFKHPPPPWDPMGRVKTDPGERRPRRPMRRPLGRRR
jgi:ATP-dependent RNA helicase RhlE